MFGLTASFFVVEIVVGHVTNSMALIADSFHMLSDIAALVIAFISVRMAPKSWDKNTYGWARAEVLGALVNAVFLVALCFSISIESFKRFYEPEDIHDPRSILIVGALGLLVNLLGLCLFHEHGGHAHGHSHGGGNKRPAHHGTHSHLAALGVVDDDVDMPKSVEDALQGHGHGHSHGHGHGHSHGGQKSAKAESSGSQMNMRGVFLHVAADALGSVVVIVSACIMAYTEWEYKKYVDPALSLVLVCIMMRGVWPLLIESALILLQTVPTHIDVDVLQKKLLERIDGILDVHDFHVWQLTGDRIIASAHVRCLNISEYMKIAENVKEFFHNEGIHSTTIQPEFVDAYHPEGNDGNEGDCMIVCPKELVPDPACETQVCCPVTNGKRGSRSTQNTPTTSRRPINESEGNNSGFNRRSVRSDSVRSYTTSTPNRQSAPNLMTVLPLPNNQDLELTSSPSKGNELTAEIDLSDDLGVSPIHDSHEDTPMFTPRTNSRIVRIISKQSNV